VLQFHPQFAALDSAGQFLTAMPYLATFQALIVLSLRRKPEPMALGSLGLSFMPAREARRWVRSQSLGQQVSTTPDSTCLCSILFKIS
jgi:hypothetical protein